MKKEIKNKEIPVEMLIDTVSGPRIVRGTAIVTNDSHGKNGGWPALKEFNRMLDNMPKEAWIQ